MTIIAVCPLTKLEATLQQTGSNFLLSLLSMDTEFSRPAGIEADNHLILRFNDIITPKDGLVLPNQHHVERIIRFALNWDQKLPIVVHCWAGISRSPAAAAIIAVALDPSRDVLELATSLRTLSPMMTPNIKMIELADELLGLDGKFLDAISLIGRGQDTFEGNQFQVLI